MKTLLFNPFEKYSDRTLIAFGLLFSLIGGYLGFVFNARFDGVIDLHFVEKVSVYQPLFDIAIDIFCSSILLFSVGKLINNKTRFIDILSVSMIARIPFYFLSFFNINNLMYNISKRILSMIAPEKIHNFVITDIPVLLVVSMTTILFLIWLIVLLYNGFKVATNAKETKHTLFFIGALIFAEILSKILIITLN
ncbi:hypothetical protein E0I26_04735 [Flavobacterium rhamnosiphilum]|uniref:Yip1 domain-containing protein n=1 Tax=Flavobacterium rhamnosiphilum TaxID=2541724 RepID=A0A4R5FBZ6_9FLAO|nr:YIP1 family protein [Flavobacterium rhamnosiphilum]TDE45997.1 hypothetical protein E0I26_04735 [Flavobacterium rhamnosiphilum]